MGGIETFLETILPHLDAQFDLKLIGMSLDEPLGQWTTISVCGQTYAFLPVLSRHRAAWLPDRLQLMTAMARYADEVALSGADAYYVHMTEAAISLLTLTRNPVVVHVHGLYNLFEYSRYRLGAAFAHVYDRCYPQLFSRCAKVIGVGSDQEYKLFAERMHVRSGVAIPTCVRTDVFRPRPRCEARKLLGIAESDRIALFVGRMTPTKNPFMLLDAVHVLRNELPHLKPVFIGNGLLREQLESACRIDGNAATLGRLDAREVALWMNAADVMSVVSKTEAFTSFAALEALSCGLPVVATPVSALPEIIREGVNGTVARDHSVEAYASALRSVLLSPPDKKSCVESVRAYLPEIIAERVACEIRDAIDGTQIRRASRPHAGSTVSHARPSRA